MLEIATDFGSSVFWLSTAAATVMINPAYLFESTVTESESFELFEPRESVCFHYEVFVTGQVEVLDIISHTDNIQKYGTHSEL